ncbi:hypothetical protein C8F04DRAFT_1252413 [Mycena alexandri]|uniref:Uncharacterized protein n=1 Tax=Mycena alexandri TaxID=1745969 RepID=A0AAD6XBH9_9AGAR|nr:hypothetical protein C8F04DRAFT_1252413 [Mycena alexandri]
MSCVPPWSEYNLTGRGKLVLLPFDLVDIIEDELLVFDRRHFVERVFRRAQHAEYARARVRTLPPPDSDSASSSSDSDDSEPDVAMPDVDNVPSTPPDVTMPTAMALDSQSCDSDSNDEDFVPRADWCNDFIEHWSPPTLRARAPALPAVLQGMHPVPKYLSRGHMSELGFRLIKWDEPRAFSDMCDRIGCFFIGPPLERSAWEKNTIAATNLMHEVRQVFERTPGDDSVLSDGVTYSAYRGRPVRIKNTFNNMVALAVLRSSPAIQQITSYQNAMLQTVAPRMWDTANKTVDAIVDNDPCLRLPCQIPNCYPRQPTAFTEVHYRFSVDDSLPRPLARASGQLSGWDAITSLGHYDSHEALLILWEDQSIVTFPPGSTFFLPAGLLNQSFTTVLSDHSTLMTITQSLRGELHDYVANGFQAEPDVLPPLWMSDRDDGRAIRRERAEILAAMYPTVQEFDASFGEYRN